MLILVAGTHRCGSTWVANVLGHSSAVHNVYEPDSPLTDILGYVSSHRLGEYPLLSPGERSNWYSMVWDLAFAGGWPWSRSPTARRAGRGLVRVPAAVRDHGVAGLARAVTALRSRPENVLSQVGQLCPLLRVAGRTVPAACPRAAPRPSQGCVELDGSGNIRRRLPRFG